MGKIRKRSCSSPLVRKRNERMVWLGSYTLLFAVMAALTFFWYIITDMTLISDTAGMGQYYSSLLYFRSYLRDVLVNLIGGNGLVLPTYEFTLGLGGDILTTLVQYALGDPLSLLCMFFDEDKMWLCYNIIVILRMYFSGLAFGMLSFTVCGREKPAVGVLAGSACYAFCGWALCASVNNVYFLNPLIWLPLVIAGAQKILDGKRPYLLVLSVYFAAVGCVSFFAMMALALIVFIIVRAVTLKGEINGSCLVGRALKSILFFALGAGLAAVVLYPVIIADLNEITSGTLLSLLLFPFTDSASTLEYVTESLGSSAFSTGLTVSVVAIPAIVTLFMVRKKNTTLKIMLVLAVLVSFVPCAWYVLTQDAYIVSVWGFALALAACMAVTVAWEDMIASGKRENLPTIIIMSAYMLLVVIFTYDESSSLVMNLVMALVIIAVLLLFPSPEKTHREYSVKQVCVVLVAVVSVLLGQNFDTGLFKDNAVADSAEIEEAENITVNTALAAQRVAASTGYSGYLRYETNSQSNDGFVNGVSSTSSLWSSSNQYQTYAAERLGLNSEGSSFGNYDLRASLLSLAGVKYYVTSSAVPPYGFSWFGDVVLNSDAVEEYMQEMTEKYGELSDDDKDAVTASVQESYYVYTNNYALPLGYTYSTAVAESDTLDLNAVQLQELMLQSLVVSDEALADSDASSATYRSTLLWYSITAGDGVTVGDNYIVTTGENNTVTLDFVNFAYSETYIVLEGLSLDTTTEYERYMSEDYGDPDDVYSQLDWLLLERSDRIALYLDSLTIPSASEETYTLTFATYDSAGNKKTSNININEDDVYICKNLAYFSRGATRVTITFSEAGVYTFDSLYIICQRMDNYADQIAALSEDALENIEIGTDSVFGTISLDEDKWLCVAFPYSEGWTVYVDGVETEYTCANLQYIGLKVSAGEHEILLVYRTPGLDEGVILSIACAALFVLAIVIGEILRRKKRVAQRKALAGEPYAAEAEKNGVSPENADVREDAQLEYAMMQSDSQPENEDALPDSGEEPVIISDDEALTADDDKQGGDVK